jgi:hypothetical protein
LVQNERVRAVRARVCRARRLLPELVRRRAALRRA